VNNYVIAKQFEPLRCERAFRGTEKPISSLTGVDNPGGNREVRDARTLALTGGSRVHRAEKGILDTAPQQARRPFAAPAQPSQASETRRVKADPSVRNHG